MAFRQTVCTLAPRALRTSSLMSPLRASASIPSTFKITNSLLTRGYASGGALNAEQIQQRINDVLKSFEKVDVNKLSASSSFTSDLGLDSLDAVEVVMAIEEEFSIEIPDAEADNITTVQQAIDYISKTPEAI